MASRRVATILVRLDHLFLSIFAYPPPEEEGENEEMDEGGNGILSSSDSGDTPAARKRLPQSLDADLTMVVRVAAETFCSTMLAVYKPGEDSKSTVHCSYGSLGVC